MGAGSDNTQKRRQGGALEDDEARRRFGDGRRDLVVVEIGDCFVGSGRLVDPDEDEDLGEMR